MRQLSLKDKICILAWALMLKYNGAEREHFYESTRLTWDEARNHCQVCYKDLVTLNPGNIQSVAQDLTSDSWIGLRRNSSLANDDTGRTSMLWTRWANGDPLTFQNWYPGWPVFNSSAPQRSCCSCSCTCPVPTTPGTPSFTTQTEFTTPNVTDFGDFENTTEMSSFTNVTTEYWTDFTTMAPTLPVETECVRSPMFSPSFPEPEDNYIEDSCVAMLSFGSWIEKNCSDSLPYICFDDRFFGQVNVTNVTSSTAILQWERAPGNISNYRVEVKGDNMELTEVLTNLTSGLLNLTGGTRYSVKVFPVKCGRDLNPQKNTFYTIPNKVEDLAVINVTETSVFLNWSKPDGNVDFYLTKGHGTETENITAGTEISGLLPGSPYTFTVLAGVLDRTSWSEESSITAYTRPLKVSNVTVPENSNDSLLVSWRPPERDDTFVRIQALSDSNQNLYDKTVPSNSADAHQEIRVPRLPMGTKIILKVTALANGTVYGETVTVVSYTASASISNLRLETTSNSLRATWTPPQNYTSFHVLLKLDGQTVNTTNLTESSKDFVGLMNAAEYTVIVYSVSGHFLGLPVESSKFTLPNPPTNVRVTFSNETNLAFKWDAPDNTLRPTYFVSLNSSFWNFYQDAPLLKQTTYMFENLTAGTRYTFQVQTVAGEERSPAAERSHFTVAEERELILSMLCSSSEPLLCANGTTKESVFHQLYTLFNNSLGDGVFWKLERQEH